MGWSESAVTLQGYLRHKSGSGLEGLTLQVTGSMAWVEHVTGVTDHVGVAASRVAYGVRPSRGRGK